MKGRVMKDRKALAHDILYWQQGGDNFTSLLFTLLCKADPERKAKLTMCFPDEASIFMEWIESASPGAFFETYSISQEIR